MGATVSSAGPAGSGIAPGAGLIAVKVFGVNSTGATQAFISDQEAALDWLLQNRNALDLVAVNMSLGGGQYFDQATCDASNPTRAQAVANLRAAGIPVAISSGNDSFTNSMGRPGCFTAATSVGATTDADVVAGFSNNASFLDLLGPGVDVCAPIPAAYSPDNCAGGGTLTDLKDGTSMAAPHVAGAFAILQEQLRLSGADPNNGVAEGTQAVDELEQRLKDTGVPVTDIRSGADNNVTSRVDVDDALLAGPAPFPDVPNWIDTAVNWLSFYGFADGFPNGTYRPDDGLTRAQLAYQLWNINGQPGSAGDCGQLTDVPNWAEPAICWLVDNGFANGYKDNTFKPDRTISRVETTNMLWNIDGATPPSGGGCSGLTDVPAWAANAICEFVEEGYMNGYPDNTFRPNLPMTRGQTANVLYNVFS